MPTPLRLIPSRVVQDQLRRPTPQPDTSHQVTCPVCRARFIGIGDRSAEANLRTHEAKHLTTAMSKAAESARAVELVRQAIVSRIDSGELAPGQKLALGRLTAELGTSRDRVDAAVSQLIDAGQLARAGATTAYSRILVARPADSA